MRMNKYKRVYILHQKPWWKNMNNKDPNYLHKGEDTDIRFIHMNGKCWIDRMGINPWLGNW